jgi:hypothetical protein
MENNTKILLGVLGLGALAYFIFKPKAPKSSFSYPKGYKEGDYVKAVGIIFLLKDGKAYPIQGFNPAIQGQAKDISRDEVYSLPIGEMISYDAYGKIIKR